ncbi:MAG: peptidyl-prolyl cis-trans isomerase [Acidobacteria bacterium]|nr:peptidyl-prolyl cis-trans isomerase [Acidobacteriota bacterium]
MRWLLILMLAGCSTQRESVPENEPTIARVGSRDVLISEFEFYLEQAYPELGKTDDSDVLSRVYDAFIRDLCLEAFANQLGIYIGDDQVDTFIGQQMPGMTFNLREPRRQELWRMEIRRRMVIQRFLQREIIDRIQIEDDAIQAYYDNHPDEFLHPTLYRIRHVQTSDHERAESFRAELKKTKGVFTELAPNYSENEAYRIPAELPLSEYPDSFQSALVKMRQGQYSPVIEVAYGDLVQYHVLYLESLIPEVEESLDDAYARIKEKLEEEESRKRFDAVKDQMQKSVVVKQELQSLPFSYVRPSEHGDET